MNRKLKKLGACKEARGAFHAILRGRKSIAMTACNIGLFVRKECWGGCRLEWLVWRVMPERDARTATYMLRYAVQTHPDNRPAALSAFVRKWSESYYRMELQ